MRLRSSSSVISFTTIAAVAVLSACSSEPEVAASEPLGTIEFALVQAPSNLACMRVTVTGNVTSTQFVSVVPGASTQFTLMGLPTGAVTVKADGFSQVCPAVMATTVPAWISNVASVTLTPGVTATVNLMMLPNGSATIVADFPTPNPTTPDTTRPTLVSFTPVNGATNVPKTTAISANFSEPIALASLTPATFSLDDLGLAPAGNYTTLGNAAVFSPSQALGPMQTYTARLTSGIRDLAGNTLLMGTSWIFRTQEGAFSTFPNNVQFNVTFVNESKIAVSRTGDAFAIWTEFLSASGWTLAVNRLSPGMFWGSPQALQTTSASGFMQGVAIAADTMGGAVAAWTTTQPGGFADVYASRFQSATGWSAPQLVESFIGTEDVAPTVAIDGAGNAIVAWVHFDAAFSSGSVWANRLVAGGGWGTPQQISTATATSTFASGPDIAATPGGDAIVVWAEAGASQQNIWANRFVAASGWGTAQLIESDGGGASSPDVAVDAAGNAIAVWRQSDGTFANAVANRFVPASGWGTPQVIDLNTLGSIFNPRVAMDAAGNAIAAWSQEEGTGASFIPRIAANRFLVTSGWGTPQNIATGTNDQSLFDPRLAVDGAGNAIATWTVFTVVSPSNAETVNAARFSPALGWGGGTTLGSPSQFSFGPSVAVDGFGRGTLIFSAAPPSFDSAALLSRRFE